MNINRSRRRRGVVLTPEGLTRLQGAIHEMEIEENEGKRYSLEELGEKIRIAPKTVSKVLDCQTGTDRRTLELCFSAFALELSPWDYEYSIAVDDSEPEEEITPGTSSVIPRSPSRSHPLEIVPLDSRFYVERPSIEEIAHMEINRPGGLLRIKATRQAGKTAFIRSILFKARERDLAIASLKLQLAEHEIFSSSERFFRWFCANLGQQLSVPARLDSFWSEDLGSLTNCSLYVREAILKPLNSPLVLALDNAHRLFGYPTIAEDFFSLLRSWHEEAGELGLWAKLRTIVTYSTESYIPHDIDRSPFNVGRVLELPPLTPEQTGKLAREFGLGEIGEDPHLHGFVKLLGGHPYLTRVALYHLAKRELSWDNLPEKAASLFGIFDDHLRFLLNTLLTRPELAATFHGIVRVDRPIPIDTLVATVPNGATIAYRLKCLGLIAADERAIEPRCDLYRLFFREQLARFPAYEILERQG